VGKQGNYIRTEEYKQKMSEAVKNSEKHKLAVSDPVYKNKMRVISINRKASPPTLKGRDNWNYGKRGILSPNFKEDTPLYRQIRNRAEYVKWRCDVLVRDNYTCQECGARDAGLEAHHKKQFIHILRENKIKSIEQAKQCSELWDIDNGKTLCKDCHKAKRMKISYHTETTGNTLSRTSCNVNMPYICSQ